MPHYATLPQENVNGSYPLYCILPDNQPPLSGLRGRAGAWQLRPGRPMSSLVVILGRATHTRQQKGRAAKESSPGGRGCGLTVAGHVPETKAVFQISHAYGHAMRQDAFWDEKRQNCR